MTLVDSVIYSHVGDRHSAERSPAASEKAARIFLLLRGYRFPQVGQSPDPPGGPAPTGDQPVSSTDGSSAWTLALSTGIATSGALSHISTKNYISSKRYWINETENAQKENGCDALTTFNKYEVRVMEGWPLSFPQTEGQPIRHSETCFWFILVPPSVLRMWSVVWDLVLTMLQYR